MWSSVSEGMIRKTLTILSLIGLLISVGVWAASYISVALFCVSLPSDYGAWADRGSLQVHKTTLPPQAIQTLGAADGISFQYGRGLRNLTIGWRWKPQYQGDTSGWSVYVPLYLPVLFFGAWVAFLVHPVHRRRKRKKLGLCVKCGYDLRESKKRCPECGTGFSK